MSEDVTGAVLSVMATPNSQDKESAEKVVNDVWESRNGTTSCQRGQQIHIGAQRARREKIFLRIDYSTLARARTLQRGMVGFVLSA